MAHYAKMKILRKKVMPRSKLMVFYYKHETKLKMLVSFMVFLGMVKSLKKSHQKKAKLNEF
jgi:hypothetical protein